MSKIDEVKKILEEYGEQIRNIIETPDISMMMVIAQAITTRDKTANQISDLCEAECQARIKELIDITNKAIDDEEELKGNMPNNIWRLLITRESATIAFRGVVKMTKKGIKDRFNQAIKNVGINND